MSASSRHIAKETLDSLNRCGDLKVLRAAFVEPLRNRLARMFLADDDPETTRSSDAKAAFEDLTKVFRETRDRAPDQGLDAKTLQRVRVDLRLIGGVEQKVENRAGSRAVDPGKSGRSHKRDSGNRLKRDAKRELVLSFLRDRGESDGTLAELCEELKKKRGLKVSTSTMCRYLKGTDYERRGNPHRAARAPGKRSYETEAVAAGGADDLSDIDAYTMPDDG